jgi:hypothetical protein
MSALLIALLANALVGPARQETKRHLESALPADVKRLVATHSLGDLTVLVARDGETASVQLDLAASGSTPAAQQRLLDLVRLSVEPGSDATTVRSLFPDKDQKPADLSFAAALTLRLPAACAVELENSWGKIVVDGRDADVHARNKFAPVEIGRVKGEVHVANEFNQVVVHDCERGVEVTAKSCDVTIERALGLAHVRTSSRPVHVAQCGAADVETTMAPVSVTQIAKDARIVAPFCAVTAATIGGALTVESGNETLTVSDVGGDLQVQHKAGKIDARRIHGKVTISGNRSDTTLEDVGGAVDVKCPWSIVRIARTGDAKVQNSSRPLEIVDPRGAVDATGNGGLVKLHASLLPADDAAHELTLVSIGGQLELELPSTGSYALDATSSVGQIECALPGMQTTLQGSARVGTLERGDAKDRKVRLHATCVGGAIRVAAAGGK